VPDTFEQPLPSGRKVIMKYPDLWELVFDDTIPDPLTGMIEGLITITQKTHGMYTQDELKAGEAKFAQVNEADNSARFIQLIVERSVVSPVITSSFEQARALKAQGVDVLHIGQLGPVDAMACYYAALGVGSQLAALFRQAESKDVSVERVPDVPTDEAPGINAPSDTQQSAVDTVHGQHGDSAVRPVGRGKATRNRRQVPAAVDG
jgi:hypothetical protein